MHIGKSDDLEIANAEKKVQLGFSRKNRYHPELRAWHLTPWNTLIDRDAFILSPRGDAFILSPKRKGKTAWVNLMLTDGYHRTPLIMYHISHSPQLGDQTQRVIEFYLYPHGLFVVYHRTVSDHIHNNNTPLGPGSSFLDTWAPKRH